MDDSSDTMQVALEAIVKERTRQDRKWGEQNHRPEYWAGIIGEEYGELCEAINETVFNNGSSKGGYENMFREAVHTAATAIAFLEYLQRNRVTFTKANGENKEDAI